MIEMDVCFTKDKMLVVHHDESLERTCGVNQKIPQLEYKDLPPFLNEVQVDFSGKELLMKTNN